MASNAGFGSFRHLGVRFLGSLDPRGPSAEDVAWAVGWLGAGEQELWRRMSGPDRRHAVGVARDVGARLYGAGAFGAGAVAAREVMAAALLHDVGKIESGLGPLGRVGATVTALALGREPVAASARGPGGRRGLRAFGAYVDHDRIGAAMLSEAGSHPTTVAWAREHHLPEGRWSVDRRIGRALKDADGD